MEKLDEELSIEHANRAKAEKSHSFLKIRRTLKILDPGLRKLLLTLPPKLNSTRSVKENWLALRVNLKRSILPMKVPWLLSDKSTTTPIAILSLESKLTLWILTRSRLRRTRHGMECDLQEDMIQLVRLG